MFLNTALRRSLQYHAAAAVCENNNIESFKASPFSTQRRRHQLHKTPLHQGRAWGHDLPLLSLFPGECFREKLRRQADDLARGFANGQLERLGGFGVRVRTVPARGQSGAKVLQQGLPARRHLKG